MSRWRGMIWWRWGRERYWEEDNRDRWWDDCLFPEYLNKKLYIFHRHPNIKLIYNELTTIDEKSKIISKRDLKYCNKTFCKQWKISYEKLVKNFYYKSRSSLMVKSELFDQYSIYCEYLWHRTLISDIYFFNQIAHNEDIFWIEEPLTYYRIHDDSLAGTIQGNIILCFDIIKYIDYLFKQKFITSSFYKNQICKYYLLMSTMLVRKLLSMWIFRVIKTSYIELHNSIRKRFMTWIK